MSCDVYRLFERSDCEAIAHYYNQNGRQSDPIWCSTGEEYDANKIWRHWLSLLIRGKGKVITQVHTRQEVFLSYFGGYRNRGVCIYSIGIVNLDLPNPMGIWRQDVAHSFAQCLKDGAEGFRITSSSDQGKFVDWAESEVGMKRVGQKLAWTTDRQNMSSYLNNFYSTPIAV